MNEKRARSKRWQYGNSLPPCTSGKRSYRSHSDARRALRRIQSISATIDPRNVYRCPDCQRYHLTSNQHPTYAHDMAATA